jgi:hypothetical protein
LLCVAGAAWLALAPLPALSALRTKLTSLEALTSAAMLDSPLPALSTPAAFCDVKPMSSICTRPVTLLTVRAGAPDVELERTSARSPT